MKNFQNIIKEQLTKSFFFVLFSTLIFAGVILAVTWPSSPPSDETPGGNFMNYFNNMLVNTGSDTQGVVNKAETLGLEGSGAVLSLSGDNLKTLGSLQFGFDAESCTGSKAGATRYSNTDTRLEYCDGVTWMPIGSGEGDGNGSLGITWLDTPIQVLSDTTLSSNYETATISQVPANGTAIFRVHIRIPRTGQDEIYVYIRKKGSTYSKALEGLDFNNNRSPDHLYSQIMIPVNENSQIEYKVGDTPLEIDLDLLGYIDPSNGDAANGTTISIITDDCRIVEDTTSGQTTAAYCDADEVAVSGGTWRHFSGTYIGTLPTETSKAGGSANGRIGRVEGGGDRAFTAVKCCKTKKISSYMPACNDNEILEFDDTSNDWECVTQLWGENGANIYRNSNIGIGIENPTYKLHVDGDIGATAYYYTSDRNLKKNIQTLDNTLLKLTQINGIKFLWRKTGEKDIGVIAQEVEKVYPELVKTDKKTGLKSVKYGNFIGPIIEAIKEIANKIEHIDKIFKLQQIEIEKLKKELEIQNEIIESLEIRLKKLETK